MSMPFILFCLALRHFFGLLCGPEKMVCIGVSGVYILCTLLFVKCSIYTCGDSLFSSRFVYRGGWTNVIVEREVPYLSPKQ